MKGDGGWGMVNILVPIVEKIDHAFFGKTSQSAQKSLLHILKKLTEESSDE